MSLRSQARKTLLPLLILATTPSLAIFVWYTDVMLDGSVLRLLDLFLNKGIWEALKQIWGPIFLGSSTAWLLIAVFGFFQLFLMKALPGKTIEGPVTPKGNIPIYKANGVSAFVTTILAFFLSTSVFKWFPATIIYDNFGPLLGALNLFSFCFCLFLYFKGRFAPSSSDSGIKGNFLFDFFWGVELYPRIFGWDVKMFTNCRFGMMAWPVIILSFAAKQQELYGLSNSMLVATALQLIYVGKFFVWEPGYLRSMDIMHDRAGYMICWGCLVWVPGVYTSVSLYLVNHPYSLPMGLASFLLAVGSFFILINYLADRQRQKVRATQGDCLVWKKKPTLIEASYQTVEGETKQTVLLASGWWGLARHFHYIPEILAALCWTLPALFYHVIPYFYVIFLTILLLDRAFRHERRCAFKYGQYWDAYCEKVPYKIIPYIY